MEKDERDLFEEKVKQVALSNDLKRQQVPNLEKALQIYGQQGLVGKKFIGFDSDSKKGMIYRIDKYEHNESTNTSLIIRDLTSGEICEKSIIMLNHFDDLHVTYRNLNAIASQLELSIEHFHWHV